MPLTIIPGSGLPVLRIITNIATTAPKAPAMAVLVATMANCTSVAASVEAALKPNQPNSRMKQPSMAIGMWWPGMRVRRAVLCTCRCAVRARCAPARAAAPPTACTTPEPAKST